MKITGRNKANQKISISINKVKKPTPPGRRKKKRDLMDNRPTY